MEAVFASKSRSEWQHHLDGLEVCCEPVIELNEVESHPQVVARRLIEREGDQVEVRPAIPMRADWRRLDAPGLGQHTAEILAEVGVDSNRLEALRKEGAV
jgi:crotonobetainyl-CoA:carnitine CoA-transferase CaiB-like acyl-CoA transferase